MNFKNILIPFDGSKFSKREVLTTVNLAQKYDGRYQFLLVLKNSTLDDGL